MNNHFHSIPQDKAPEILNLIVEIPRGEMNKYEYNKEYGILELDRVLPGPTVYPTDYCDVPSTWNSGDNDPLDAVLFSSGNPIYPGTLAKGRVIGMMEMIDGGEVDHKIICVNANDNRYDHVKHVDDLTPFQRKDLATFMEVYKYATKGPDAVKIGDFHGPEKAYELINQSLEEYKNKFKQS